MASCSSSVQPQHPRLPLLFNLNQLRPRLHELHERPEFKRLLVELRVHALHLLLHGRAVLPVVVVFLAEVEGALEQHGRLVAVAAQVGGCLRDGRRLGLDRLGGLDRLSHGSSGALARLLDARQVVVVRKLTARIRERRRHRPSDADADHIPVQPLGALRERDVVAVAGDDDDVGDGVQSKEVFDHVDGQANIRAVLGGRGGEHLREVNGARDELALVGGVDRQRPVGVGAADDDGAEAGGIVENGADIDGGVIQSAFHRRVVGEVAQLVTLEGWMHLRVPRDDDVVEVDIDGNAGVDWFRHGASLSALAWKHPCANLPYMTDATPTDPTAPAHAAPAPYSAAAPTPAPAKPKTLGTVAFVLALAVFVISLAVSVLNGMAAAPFADTRGGLSYSTDLSSSDPAEAAVGIASMAHILIGSLLGITALVLGIIAAASNRGRALGIVGAVLAFLAPGLSLAVFFGVLAASV
jgi:hypothetical protein